MIGLDKEYILLVPGNYAEEFDKVFEYLHSAGIDLPEERVIVADDMQDSLEIATRIPFKIILVLTNTNESRKQIMWIFNQAKRWGKIPDVTLKGLDLDPITRVALVGDRRVRLSKLENEVLALFIERAGSILDTKFILSCVWGSNEKDTSLVRGIISRIRKKIEEDPDQPKFIITHDHGYSLGVS